MSAPVATLEKEQLHSDADERDDGESLAQKWLDLGDAALDMKKPSGEHSAASEREGSTPSE